MARYRPAAGAKEAKTRRTPTMSRAAKGSGSAGRGGRGLPEREQVRTKRVKAVDQLNSSSAATISGPERARQQVKLAKASKLKAAVSTARAVGKVKRDAKRIMTAPLRLKSWAKEAGRDKFLTIEDFRKKKKR